MGTSSTAAEFSSKLARMTEGVAKIPQTTARQNAATAEKALGAAVDSMSRGGNLSRANGGRGAAVGVNTTILGGAVAVTPRGPVGLVENPIEPHQIGGTGSRLRIGSRWVTGPVQHPGTRGKGQWARARDGLVDPVRTNVAGAMTDTTKQAFG